MLRLSRSYLVVADEELAAYQKATWPRSAENTCYRQENGVIYTPEGHRLR